MIAAIFDSQANAGKALDELYRRDISGDDVALMTSRPDIQNNVPFAANVSAPQTGSINGDPAIAGAFTGLVDDLDLTDEQMEFYRQAVGTNGLAVFVDTDDEDAIVRIFKMYHASRVDRID